MDHKLLWRLHNWIGLYAGVVIAFLSLTGAAALFRPEIDRALNPHLTKVAPGDQQASLTEAVNTVLEMHPDKYLFEVEMPKEHLDTWNIRLMPLEKEPLYPMIWEVFVHPYTGEILGERNYFESFSYFLRNIHVRFYEAEFGRQIVGLAGLALLFSTVTGFLIYGRFMKKQPFGKVRRKKLRMQQADLHKLIGISTLVFNLVIAITGAWLGLQVYLMQAFDIAPPNRYKREVKPLEPQEDRVYALDFDAIYQLTRSEFPEMIPWYIRPTTNGEALVQVLGNVPGQAYERRSNKLVVDKMDNEILFRYNISDQKAGAKLFYVQESFHFGDFAGLPLKLIYCMLALSSGFLSLSGFIIYLERTKKARKHATPYTPLKPLLIRWTLGMVGFCAVVGLMSTQFGIGIPSLMVSLSFYGFLLFRLFRHLLQWIKTKYSTPVTA